MPKPDFIFILKSFLVWRILIFIPIFLAPYFFKLQNNFLGGGMENYLSNPYLWSWANFDGEHYLSIAKMGYANGEQSFFPLYPILINFFSNSLVLTLVVSNLLFFMALIGLYRLVLIDFDKKIAKLTIIMTLLFPGSFFFAAVYTESLFLLLTVWSFYWFRKEKYLLSAIFGIFATSARVVGIVLLPVYFVYIFIKKQKLSFKHIPLLFIPLGLLNYMYYSFIKWADPLKFFNMASGFGEQRSDHLIVLPQVFYRYFVKIVPNLTWDYFPVVFTTLMELSVAVIFLVLIIYAIKKIKFDYWFFFALIYLVPTLSGSFSSLPRYVLVAFPAFILIAQIFEKRNLLVKTIIIITFVTLSVIMQMLFVRGYFVS